MRIVTNPGSNIGEETALACDIDILPQKIMVDGMPHDTRNTIDFDQVQRWVSRAHVHPQVRGTSRSDFTEYLSRVAPKDREVLAVMTSRKIIESHDEALAAVRELPATGGPAMRGLQVNVIDTLATDVAAGLVTFAAVQARAAGLDRAKATAFLNSFAQRGRAALSLTTLDYVIKGGRASFLTGWLADFLRIRPILTFAEGKVETATKISASANRVEKLVGWLTDRIDPGTAVWVGVAHGQAEQPAQELLALLRDRYKVEFAYSRPLSTSIFLHCGPGALLACVYPLDGHPFRPTPPTVRD